MEGKNERGLVWEPEPKSTPAKVVPHEFRYGETVRIKNGFYGGLIGVLKAVTMIIRDYNTVPCYSVHLESGEFQSFYEEDIEYIPKTITKTSKKR